DTKLAIGGALLFVGNARVVVNLICSGMFDRYPALKMVSVESGMGWVPFILEALDYEMDENAPAAKARMKLLPSEYFKQNIYATRRASGVRRGRSRRRARAVHAPRPGRGAPHRRDARDPSR